MRDILDDLFKNEPLDPIEAARKSVRVTLRKRFYKQAAVSGAAVTLDGKPVKTPARRPLAAPTRALADALAQEWNAQEDIIDPNAMPLTRLANAAIDVVAEAPQAVAAEVENYLGTDLLLYRAEAPPALRDAQARLWDPFIDWAHEALGARFVLAQGVIPVTQPPAAIAAAARAIPADTWRLAAIASVTALTGSALLALALAAGVRDADAVWAAAHVDEDWQMARWGRDELALQRRAFREAEMKAAAAVLTLI